MERKIWLYVDRELPADQIAEVTAALEACEHCREYYHDCAREANSYRVAFVDTPFGERFATSFLRRMENEGLVRSGSGAKGRGPAKVERPDVRFRRDHRRKIYALAAMLLFVSAAVTLGVYFTRPYPRPVLGALRSDGHAVSILRGDQREAKLVEKCDVHAGDHLIVPTGGDLLVTIRPTTRGQASLLRLLGPARFHVDGTARTDLFRGTLESGLLVADVGKDPLRRTFSIETETSAVDVLGTRFMLEATEAGSRLTVLRGRVAFRSLQGSNVGRELVTPASGSRRTEVERAGVFAAADVELPGFVDSELPLDSAGPSDSSDPSGHDDARGDTFSPLESVPSVEPPATAPPPPESSHPARPDLDRPVTK